MSNFNSIAALSLAFTLLISVVFSTSVHASAADEEEWETHYAVNDFANTGTPDPHQIFKIYYRAINGTVEEFNMLYIEYAHYIEADVSSSNGNATLEIRFPKNYPIHEGGDYLDPIIIFDDREILPDRFEATNCFYEYSIPYNGNGVIDVAWATILTEQSFIGVDVPEDCMPETLVQGVVKTNDDVISPFRQLNAGVKADEVICDIVTHPNGKQYCATPASTELLKERWKIPFETTKTGQPVCLPAEPGFGRDVCTPGFIDIETGRYYAVIDDQDLFNYINSDEELFIVTGTIRPPTESDVFDGYSFYRISGVLENITFVKSLDDEEAIASANKVDAQQMINE